MQGGARIKIRMDPSASWEGEEGSHNLKIHSTRPQFDFVSIVLAQDDSLELLGFPRVHPRNILRDYFLFDEKFKLSV